ncbi:hypothetical protein [Devosia yakushimensis]|nr:hypothetical protein [Devosia yakushimensis]
MAIDYRLLRPARTILAQLTGAASAQRIKLKNGSMPLCGHKRLFLCIGMF